MRQRFGLFGLVLLSFLGVGLYLVLGPLEALSALWSVAVIIVGGIVGACVGRLVEYLVEKSDVRLRVLAQQRGWSEVADADLAAMRGRREQLAKQHERLIESGALTPADETMLKYMYANAERVAHAIEQAVTDQLRADMELAAKEGFSVRWSQQSIASLKTLSGKISGAIKHLEDCLKEYDALTKRIRDEQGPFWITNSGGE